MARTVSISRQSSLPPAVAVVIAVAVLYFGRRILIPFALALLIAFLLAPIVKRLETWRIPRVIAVVGVILVTFGSLSGIGWVVTNQLVEIVTQLPSYRENIRLKMQYLKPNSGGISNVLNSVEDLGKELTTRPPAQPAPVAPRRPARSAVSNSSGDQPVRVEVVEPPPNALQSLRNILGPLLGPLETAGIVIVFTLFMLLDREDLRNRLLGLIGMRQLHVTTRAMDDAAQRVGRYLMMQFLVNATYGAVIALGLFLIGVKSSLLWGVLAMLLRFLPYVGPVAGGALPLVLTLATTEGWRSPLLVFALFVVVELITGNVVEPLVYGAHTGLSPVAILISLVFWTVIWGPVGLILATPLTVCLSVLGRHSPHLQFLDIVLGAEPVLTPDALFYQRLLALDQQDAMNQLETLAKDKPIEEIYDSVVIPALAHAEQDRHGGSLEDQRLQFILQSINEFVTEIGDGARRLRRSRKNRAGTERALVQPDARSQVRIFCIPAHDEADEITSAILAQVADRQGFPALAFPVTESPADLLQGLAPEPGEIVCVSSVPPLAITHARTVSQQIREALPDATILIGLWTYASVGTRTVERLQEAASATVVTTLVAALQQIRALATPDQAPAHEE